ncbi:unnamed protein product, partial [Iphiclides podalirius]
MDERAAKLAAARQKLKHHQEKKIRTENTKPSSQYDVSKEERLQAVQKERDNLSSHYEHYVSDLNTQLKTIGVKNNSLSQEINQLYNRENSLVEQISELEKRLQSYQTKILTEESDKTKELQENIKNFENKYQELHSLYDELQLKYKESQEHLEKSSKSNIIECDKDEISISKLNADITSDKIAAQRATEQNKKLKTDLEELEFAFVKMSKDKLDLTEKLTYEKQLSKELMLKLADIEENNKSLFNKIMAKDEEMIRLQNSYRALEKDYEEVLSKCQKHIENEKNIVLNDEIDIKSNEKEVPFVSGDNEEKKESIETDEELRVTKGKGDGSGGL